VLRKHVRDDTVDLYYIDPPFNSKRFLLSGNVLSHASRHRHSRSRLNLPLPSCGMTHSPYWLLPTISYRPQLLRALTGFLGIGSLFESLVKCFQLFNCKWHVLFSCQLGRVPAI